MNEQEQALLELALREKDCPNLDCVTETLARDELCLDCNGTKRIPIAANNAMTAAEIVTKESEVTE